MSIYADACFDIAFEQIAKHDTINHAFNGYITSRELGELVARERAKFDQEHANRYGGSQKAWDEKVWYIAKEVWCDAVATLEAGLKEFPNGIPNMTRRQ